MWLNLNHKPNRVLWVIIGLGLILRIWFNLVSNHIYHPDEVFQTLEPAYRLVYGYGLIPWDYTYGLRSWLVTYFFSIPLLALKIIGFTSPLFYVPLIKLFLCLISLSVIFAAYFLTQKLIRKTKPALMAAFLTAIWYELIYFSGRALTEVLATYLFSIAIILLFIKKPKIVIASFLITLATLVRPQYFLVPLLFFYILKKLYRSIIIGFLIALVLYGLVDYSTLGIPFISLINNFKLSFLSGISQTFGISPWYYYLQAIFITSFGLSLFALVTFKHPKAQKLLYLYLAVLLTHSLITHKEYRFIFILVPIFLILIVTAFYQIWPKASLSKERLFVSLVCVISLLGLLGQLPGQSLIYHFYPLAHDPILNLNPIVNKVSACGLFLPDRGWVTSGGYYYLGVNLPLFTFDYPPPSSNSADLMVYPRNSSGSFGQTLTLSPTFKYLSNQGPQIHPGYIISKVASTCLVDHHYTYQRSFDYLLPYLKYARTY